MTSKEDIVAELAGMVVAKKVAGNEIFGDKVAESIFGPRFPESTPYDLTFDIAGFDEKTDELHEPKLRTTVKRILAENAKVYMKYKKVDGSLKVTAGTLHPNTIDKYHTKPSEKIGSVAKAKRKENFDILPYFDLLTKDFRSFRVENLIVLSNDEYFDPLSTVSKEELERLS